MEKDIDNQKESSISAKEELELKIKNRFSWLIIGSVSISVIGIMYAFIFEAINIDFITIVTLVIAFFSIYLSALFYFKATEQSNSFYDRSFNHTKQIQVLLSQMEGKFNKSLDVLEKGNETIRATIETGKGIEYLGKANSDIEGLEKRKERFLEDSIFSKIQLSIEEKEKIKDELKKLEKEKSLLQYQLNEILDDTNLRNRNAHSIHVKNKKAHRSFRQSHVKSNTKEKFNSHNGFFRDIILKEGPENILNMSRENLKVFLNKKLLGPLEFADPEEKEILLNTFKNLGFIDEKTNAITDTFITHFVEEAHFISSKQKT